MRGSPRLWLACALSLVTTACTTSSNADPNVDTRASSLGLLQVDRFADGTTAELGAAFARFRGTDTATVAHLLSGGSDAELDACSLGSGELDALLSSEATVDLLDVGTIDVHVGNAEAHLVPRTFPELARVAAGFFYAGDADISDVASGAEEYTFHADASAELPGFEVAVPAPLYPADVRVNGAPLQNGMSLSRARELDVTWEANDPRDHVEIDVMAVAETVSCRSRDDGSFRISAADLAATAGHPRARIVVRRVRVQPFDATGVDVAYVRLAATRAFDVTLE